MSAFYDRLNATARRLIQAYGKSASVIRIALSGPPHAPVQTETPHACMLVETGYKLTLIPESLVQVGDRMGIISTTIAISPETADKIEIGGIRYNFVDVKPLNPGGTVLLYEFLARA
ncbi:hypothetical protein [Panacagrimonas sp.]|uniref:hypothetical protein n=1 Tax=Panacagrimonas sp. TaxID=2480088 RepID=UPI003B51A559